MKAYIPKEVLPFDRKAEREPRHGRQEQQPKRPKRPSEANRTPPWHNAAGQREWSCKQQHKGSPQPQCCCHNRHFAGNASVAARPVHVTVNAFKSSLSKQAWSAQRSIAGVSGNRGSTFRVSKISTENFAGSPTGNVRAEPSEQGTVPRYRSGLSAIAFPRTIARWPAPE